MSPVAIEAPAVTVASDYLTSLPFSYSKVEPLATLLAQEVERRRNLKPDDPFRRRNVLWSIGNILGDVLDGTLTLSLDPATVWDRLTTKPKNLFAVFCDAASEGGDGRSLYVFPDKTSVTNFLRVFCSGAGVRAYAYPLTDDDWVRLEDKSAREQYSIIEGILSDESACRERGVIAFNDTGMNRFGVKSARSRRVKVMPESEGPLGSLRDAHRDVTTREEVEYALRMGLYAAARRTYDETWPENFNPSVGEILRALALKLHEDIGKSDSYFCPVPKVGSECFLVVESEAKEQGDTVRTTLVPSWDIAQTYAVAPQPGADTCVSYIERAVVTKARTLWEDTSYETGEVLFENTLFWV